MKFFVPGRIKFEEDGFYIYATWQDEHGKEVTKLFLDDPKGHLDINNPR